MPETTPALPVAAAPPRRPGFWLLAAAVLLAHLLLSNQLADGRVGWGAGEAAPARIEVAFVRRLEAAAPPVVVAVPAPAAPRLPAVARAPMPAASAALAALVPVPQPLPPPTAEAPPDPAAPLPPLAATEPEPGPTPDLPARAASALAVELAAPSLPAAQPSADVTPASPAAPAVAAAPAASAASFDWPPSTRLTYKLSGHYRGPVDGTAQVEWLRQGTRYQVFLSTAIGPVMSRQISSEGELTPQGLAPRRFDGEQKVLFRAARRWQLRFGPDEVQLSDGKRVPALAGAQDEASQFVQLTWLFSTQPDKLRVGGAVEMPLAISRRLERWVYDVVGEETLQFSFGAVPSFHLKPRRDAAGGDLTAEIWIAPTLQYLPVRILIRDGQGNSVDLTLDKAPLQAGPAR